MVSFDNEINFSLAKMEKWRLAYAVAQGRPVEIIPVIRYSHPELDAAVYNYLQLAFFFLS